jgi:hypothetical protein
MVAMNSRGRNFLLYRWEDIAAAGPAKLAAGITLNVSEGTISPEPRPLADAQGYPDSRRAKLSPRDAKH